MRTVTTIHLNAVYAQMIKEDIPPEQHFKWLQNNSDCHTKDIRNFLDELKR